MTLNVGVIGVGMIGQDHIRRITHVVSGARVTAVTDVDLDRAKQVAAALPAAKALQTGQELIDDPEVDAVVVTSWGPTHEEYVLAAIAAGKQVFCEKPLATTREACERILDAEVASGRRHVMVGFMRRYDEGYRAMKAVIDGGEIGAPLMFHSGHRNPTVPAHYTSDMIINDTCVHDVDVARFLLDDEIVAVRVLMARKNSLASDHLTDPVLFVFEMAGGALVDVEASINIQYAYDIRGEVVGESGTVELGETNRVVVKSGGRFGGRVPEDWRERFIRAYDTEFAEWIAAAAAGGSTGPSAWDGYAATVVCAAGLEAMQSGERVAVSLRARPALYAAGAEMVRIALDTHMYHAEMSVADELRKAAELGYEYVELSPRADWFFWHRYPKADDALIAETKKAAAETGVKIQTLVPVFNWASPDEQERRAQVRNWRRLLQIAADLECPVVNSELSGDPTRPLASEHAFYASMEELIPEFERHGIGLNLEAHPYDFSETNDDAVQIIRGLNRPWVNYVYCAPHTFHLSDGAGDVARMMEYAGPKLQHVHVADCWNHKANIGNRYIVNPPGVDARIHQHNEIGNGEVDWDAFFGALRDLSFDGLATVCVFGWEEHRDDIHRRMLERVQAELGA